jgi:hypothetical protein
MGMVQGVGGGGYTSENARDDIAAALIAGPNVTIAPNDAANTITISASPGSGASYPTQAGETGVVDTSYPVGHGHRYGISTNPNAALAALRDLVLSTNAARSRVDASGSDRIPYDVITLPAGRFTVTQIGALLAGTPSDGRRTRGVVIQGSGRFMTEIEFGPSTSGYLFDNQDRVSRMTIRDLTFTGLSTNANFFNGVSNGGPSSMVFERIVWRGTWGKGFYLSGTDTDSEMTWNDCTMYGDWTSFLENDNPQGLNYDFISCDMEIESGWAVVMNAGGSINVTNGSWMGSRSTTTGVGGFFKMTASDAVAPGETRLHVEGIRTEHRSAAWKMIDCAWPSGVISFLSVNDVGNASIDPDAIRATFTSFWSMPVITFDSCRLAGRHEYVQTGTNDQAPTRLITYRNSVLQHRGFAEDFIVTTLSGTAVGRDSARPPIRFERCRSGVSGYDSWNIMDQTLNGGVAQFAVLRKQTVSLKYYATGSGDLPGPGAGVTATLPLGAIITSIRLFAPAGASAGSSTAWNFQVKSGTTGTVTTLLNYGGAQTAAGMSAGYSTEVIPMFVCTTLDNRDITLTGGASNSASGDAALCLVEYLS